MTIIGKSLSASLMAAALGAIPAANAAPINVNFNGFTANSGPTQVESTLEGPAGGLGTSWNQYAANSSSGTMVDSDGAPTSVTVATNFSEGRYDEDGVDLTMLRATLTDFGRGQSRAVTISGLDEGGLYSIWLVSHRHQPPTRERQKGTWSTTHTTTSSSSQLVDGTDGALNGSTFVAGVNYALFENVEADASGQIVFNGKAATLEDGFDDDYRLHLNGIQIIPESSSVGAFRLTITPNAETAGSYDLEWDSQAGKLYNLRTSTDLSGGISTWTLVEGDIEATPPTNLFTVAPAEAMRFYAVEEFDAPPPPPLLSEDFEENDGGFTVATVEGTAWEHGAPDSSGLGGTVNAGNDGSANAWATNLGTVSTAGGSPTAVESGFYADPTHTALRSPVIDLTGVSGAELTFAEALDFPDTDTAVVNLINATTEDVIAQVHASEDGDISNASWNGLGPIDLAAGVGQQVRLEWRFEGAGGPNDDFMGWYIDDVVVRETTP